MKAFEKWYKQYKYSGDFATTYCEDGWKAALKWVLSHYDENHYRINEVNFAESGAWSIIEEELKDV